MKYMTAFATTVLSLVIFTSGCTPSPSPSPLTVAPQIAAPQKDSGNVAPTDRQKRWDDTLSAAKREGEILIYLNAPSEGRAAISDAFSQKFGLKIDVVMGSAAELNTRLASEYRAGIHQTDAILVGASSIWSSIKPQGFLSPIEPMLMLPELKDPKVWLGGNLPFFDRDGTVLSYLSVANPPVVYNANLVREGEITSYLDLLKPEWKGKMVVFDPSVAGGGQFGAARLSLQWGVDKANEYFNSLVRQQEIMITRDQRQQMDWVARGKYAVALWPNSPATIEFLQVGAPIATTALKENIGVSASNGGLAIPTKPPHPNATVVFLNWFLGREAQTLVSKAMGAPSSRIDVPLEGIALIFAPKPADKVFVQNEEFTTAQNQLIEGYKNIFGPGR